MAAENTKKLWDLIDQQVQTKDYQHELETTEKGKHPAEEVLYAYGKGQLDTQQAMDVSMHIAFCRQCAKEAARIMRQIDLREHMAVEFWQPEGAGEQQVAAATPKQEHEINMDDGSINIECIWDRTYIWFSWRARIETDRELSVLFINPDTREIRYEESLGTIRHGDTTFTSKELGFDPTKEKWAIVIA